MAQLVASMSGVVLGGVALVVGSNLARGKIFTASISSVDSLFAVLLLWIVFVGFASCWCVLFFVALWSPAEKGLTS